LYYYFKVCSDVLLTLEIISTVYSPEMFSVRYMVLTVVTLNASFTGRSWKRIWYYQHSKSSV